MKLDGNFILTKTMFCEGWKNELSALRKLESIERRLIEIHKALSKIRGSFIYVCGECGQPYQKRGDLKLHCQQKHRKKGWK
jgi:hypothetical protein